MAFRSLPLEFVENRGQMPKPARYVVGAPHAPAWVTDCGIVLTILQGDVSKRPSDRERPRRLHSVEALETTPVRGAHVALTFEGASAASEVESVEPSSAQFSYFLGDDPSQWVKGVPGSRRLRWSGLYPGVSVELHGEAGTLEYDVHLESGADLSQVSVRVEGADRLSVQDDGSLRIDTAAGAIHQAPPPTWVVLPDGGQRSVACHYVVLDDWHYGFSVDGRDADRPLVIDPELQFGTFVGGSGSDECRGIAVDASGSAYIAGYAGSIDFPVTPGAFDTTIGTIKPDGVIAKLSAAGESLLYATYLGGNDSSDSVTLIDVTVGGEVVVAGGTGSSDFPTTIGALDTTIDGETDSFVTRLSADGSSLIYSTLIGGNDDDAIQGMELDSQERACFAGMTRSPDFPVTPNAFVPTINPALLDGMLGRLSPDGTTLDYGTFMPGASNTQCLALDPDGNACVGGGASSFYVTTPGAFQTPTGNEFIYKFDFDSSAFVFSSMFGGWTLDFLESIAVDSVGAVYAAGDTDSFNFPTTAGAYDTSFNGDSDAFVVKLSSDGSTLEYGTFFGGSADDPTFALALDSQDRAYIAGRTFSTNLPVTPDAFDSALSGGDGAFFAQLSADGSELLYATYFGGTTFWQFPLDIAIDAFGDAFVVGYTHAPDFPTTPGSFMPDYGTATPNQGFVLKFAFGPWSSVGHSLAGMNGLTPALLGEGSLEPGSAGSIELAQARPLAPAYLLLGLSHLDAAFKGGTMVPDPLLLIPLSTNSLGGLTLSWAHWPSGLPAGTE
ncbi:MAG TPA: SBBP repeat-containing protein, partial [Planctomycetota bacterium]|nr:SBBP repeat-containing protein [Planctomycetota bacterium]